MNSNRTTVGLVAVILGLLGFGWIGIHKFMMGYQRQAVIMIVSSILTCGIAACVWTIVSIIEGIIYLTKTDAEFDRVYSGGNQPWF